MRVLFIYREFESLGVQYLSAMLERHGFQTKLILDLQSSHGLFGEKGYLGRFFKSDAFILQKVIEYNPELIAFSVVSWDYLWAINLAKKIKSTFKAHICFGGIHVTMCPEEVISNEFIDSIVIGEGDYAFLDLANSIRARKINYSIKNIWFNQERNIIRNPLRPLIENLDELPFPNRRIFAEQSKYFSLNYHAATSRGCINNCSYCYTPAYHAVYAGQSPVRLRSVDNVIKELLFAKKQFNFRKLFFNDDDFVHNKDWLKEFTRRYKNEINVSYYCLASPASLDREAIGYLKQSNCRKIRIGVQSVNWQIRTDLFFRKDTDEQIIQAIHLCRDNDIAVAADNIFGYPGNKPEDILDAIKFYNNNRVDRILINWLNYYHKTPIVKLAFEKKALGIEKINRLTLEPYNTLKELKSDATGKQIKKYILFLELVHILPKGLVNSIIKFKLFKFFPAINPIWSGFLVHLTFSYRLFFFNWYRFLFHFKQIGRISKARANVIKGHI